MTQLLKTLIKLQRNITCNPFPPNLWRKVIFAIILKQILLKIDKYEIMFLLLISLSVNNICFHTFGSTWSE